MGLGDSGVHYESPRGERHEPHILLEMSSGNPTSLHDEKVGVTAGYCTVAQSPGSVPGFNLVWAPPEFRGRSGVCCLHWLLPSGARSQGSLKPHHYSPGLQQGNSLNRHTEDAEREAGRILGEAGLQPVWLDCLDRDPAADPQELCHKAREPIDVVLRVLPGHIQGRLKYALFGFVFPPALASVY